MTCLLPPGKKNSVGVEKERSTSPLTKSDRIGKRKRLTAYKCKALLTPLTKKAKDSAAGIVLQVGTSSQGEGMEPYCASKEDMETTSQTKSISNGTTLDNKILSKDTSLMQGTSHSGPTIGIFNHCGMGSGLQRESLALGKYCSNEDKEQQLESDYVKLRLPCPAGSSVSGIEENSVKAQSYELETDVDNRHKRSSNALLSHQEMEAKHTKENRFCVPRKDATEYLVHKGSPSTLSLDHEELEEGELREVPDSQMWHEQPTLFKQELGPQIGAKKTLSYPMQQGKGPDSHMCAEQLALVEQGVSPHTGAQTDVSQVIKTLKDVLYQKTIKLIKIVHSRRIDKLVQKQTQELIELKNRVAKEKDCLSHALMVDPAIEKEFDQHMALQRKMLRVMHVDARNKEKQIEEQWLEEAKVGRLVDSFDKLPLTSTGFEMEKFKFLEQGGNHDGPGNTIILSGHSSDVETRPADSIKLSGASTEVPAIAPVKRMEDIPTETETETETETPDCPSKSISTTILSGHSSDVETRPVGSIRLGGASTEVPVKRMEDIHTETETQDGRGNTIILSGRSSDVERRPVDSINLSGAFTEVPAIVPIKRIGDIPKEAETPDCPSRSINTTVGPSGTASDILATVLSEGTGDELLEPELIDSQCNIMNVAGAKLDGVHINLELAVNSTEFSAAFSELPVYFPNNGMEVTPPEPETSTSQSKSTNAVESVEPSRLSPNISASVLCKRAHDKAFEIETPASHWNIVNVAGGGIDRLHSSGKAVSDGPHEGADSDGLCLTRPLQNQTSCPSLIHASERSEYENSTPYCSVTSISPVIEPERHVVGGTGSELNFCRPRNISFATLYSGDTELPLDHNNLTVELLEPILQQISSYSSLATATPGYARPATPIRTEQEGCNQFHCFTQLAEVPTQQPVLAPTLETEQSNNAFSESSLLLMPVLANIEQESTLLEFLSSPIVQQELHPNPLDNELVRLCIQEHSINQIHKFKTHQLNLACQKELEEVNKKYHALIQVAETDFIQQKKEIERIYSLINKNQIFAEKIRDGLFGNKMVPEAVSQGGSSSSMQQLPQFTQPDVAEGGVLFSPPIIAVAQTQSLSSWRHQAPRSTVNHSPVPAQIQSFSSLWQQVPPRSVHPTQGPVQIQSLSSPRHQMPPTTVHPTPNPAQTQSRPSPRQQAPPITVHPRAAPAQTQDLSSLKHQELPTTVHPQQNNIHYTSVFSPRTDLQVRCKLRAPAPHLRPFRPVKPQQNTPVQNSQAVNQQQSISLQKKGLNAPPPGFNSSQIGNIPKGAPLSALSSLTHSVLPTTVQTSAVSDSMLGTSTPVRPVSTWNKETQIRSVACAPAPSPALYPSIPSKLPQTSESGIQQMVNQQHSFTKRALPSCRQDFIRKSY